MQPNYFEIIFKKFCIHFRSTDDFFLSWKMKRFTYLFYFIYYSFSVDKIEKYVKKNFF